MKIVLSTIGKFSTFALARQLEQQDALEVIFTGYPKFKLKDEGLPMQKIHSFPWIQTSYLALGRFGINNPWLSRELEWLSKQTFDTYVANNLPECHVFCGLSGSAFKTGKVAKNRGYGYVCARGSSHIRYQEAILREEYDIQGKPFDGIDTRVISKEEAEYELADSIKVPSTFAKCSYIEMGIPQEKLWMVPYGVDLEKFYPVDQPSKEFFDILFVGSASFRKGIPYLLQAFSKLQHPHKRLTIVGTIQAELTSILSKAAAEQNIITSGHIPQPQLKKIMSRSHVMVLPSIEDGFGAVLAQAMACGCPVISTTNTGAEDLFTDGVEGFIVPIRNADAITERLQLLADNPDLQQKMSRASLAQVKKIGGWDTYGSAMFNFFSRIKR